MSKVPHLSRLGPLPMPAERQFSSFPKQTPAWLINEFVRFPDLGKRAELIRAIQSPLVVTSRTWNAIADLEQRRRMRNPDDVTGISRSQLAPLAEFLRRGIHGFNTEKKLTKKQRAAIAKRIKNKCAALTRELVRFRDKGQYPEWSAAATDVRGALLDVAAQAGTKIPSDRRDLEQWFTGAMGALKDPLLALHGVQNTADRWVRPSSSAIYRPSEKGAARTFFISTLNRGFQSRYGEVLPDIIDAFVAALFDNLPALNESDIRKRLPVKKPVDRGMKRPGPRRLVPARKAKK